MMQATFMRRESFVSRLWSQTLSSAIALMMVMILPCSAQSQTTFEWGTARHDSLYLTVEHCLGLSERVDADRIIFDTVVRDTSPPELQVVPNARYPDAVAATAQCSEKFTVEKLLTFDSVDVNAAFNAFKLLYLAGRNSDAMTFAEGVLGKIPRENDTRRQTLRYAMVNFALTITPTDFIFIRRLVDSMALDKFWVDRIMYYGELLDRSMELRDTVALQPIIDWLLQTPTLLGDSITKHPQWLAKTKRGTFGGPSPGHVVLKAAEYQNRHHLLEQLQASTHAFEEALNLLKKSFGLTVFKGSDQEMAKPIVADYWFPDPPSTSRPTRGHIAMVVSLRGGNDCNPCRFHPMVRRLAKRFSDVQFTLLAQTWGHYGEQVGTLPLIDEVRLIDSMHRLVDGFPGAVGVVKGVVWHLPDPDQRAIDEAGPNESQYPTLPPLMRGSKGIEYRLVSRDGRFVPYAVLGLSMEESYILLLQTLLQQPAP